MKRLRWVGLVAAATLSVAGCGSDAGGGKSGDGPEQSEIRVGALPIADYAAVYWADEKGFFEKEGLDVEIEVLQGGPIGVQKVSSGELAFSFSNLVSSTVAVTNGAPVTTVALTSSLGHKAGGVFVRPESDIETLEDLDDRTLGVNTLLNVGDVTIDNLIKAEGLDTKPRYVEVPSPR